MKAIYKNELSTYFSTLIGYIVVAFMVLFAGIFTSYICLKHASTSFESVILNMNLVFLVIVPILTMRTFSEERKQRTESLLYASPVTTTEIVLGKYFALLTVLLISLAIIGLIPLFLTKFGTINFTSAYVAIGAFFILGAALLAIGMFISSLTDIQILAAGITFTLLLINFFLGDLAPFINAAAYIGLIALLVAAVLVGLLVGLIVKNWIPGVLVCLVGVGVVLTIHFVNPIAYSNLLMTAMQKIALFDRFETVMYSIVNLGDLLFLVSVSVIFVFLTVQSLEKRRWS